MLAEERVTTSEAVAKVVRRGYGGGEESEPSRVEVTNVRNQV